MQTIRNGRMLSFKEDIYPASIFLRLRDHCRRGGVEIVQEQEAMGNYKETLSSRHGRVGASINSCDNMHKNLCMPKPE